MHKQWFGDVYTYTRRALIPGVAPPKEWLAHPMLLSKVRKGEEPGGGLDTDAYAKFLGLETDFLAHMEPLAIDAFMDYQGPLDPKAMLNRLFSHSIKAVMAQSRILRDSRGTSTSILAQQIPDPASGPQLTLDRCASTSIPARPGLLSTPCPA